MPIYEFVCQACHKPFQKLFPTMNWAGVDCPKCGSRKVEKKLSRFAVGGSAAGDFDSDSGGDTASDSGPDGPAECSGDASSCQRCDLDD